MTSDNQTTDSSLESWDACPAGELQGLASRLQAAERRRQNASLAKMAAATMASTAGLVLAIGLIAGGGDSNVIGGLTCLQCASHLNEYHDHLLGNGAMPEGLADQVATHLRGCDLCHGKFEAKYPGVLETANAAASDVAKADDDRLAVWIPSSVVVGSTVL